MSDARGREAERAGQAWRSNDAEARRVVEQLRAGSRTWDDVVLDAYLGHAPAQFALNERVEPVVWREEDDEVVNRYLRGFAAWGAQVLAKIMLAWLRVGSGPEEARSSSVRSEQARAETWCTTGKFVPREYPPGSSWSIYGPSALVGNVLELAASDDDPAGFLGGFVPVCTFGRPSPAEVDMPAVRSVVRGWPLAASFVAPLPPGPDLRRRVEALGATVTGATA